ncbi:uncharacterized protein RAG0_06324 [Rhynchosporium agropyri]|uniref:Uncharacterized protein n=1 Tax=Rhynchosporium agropyri TaxID=914238 RepID=A0A1E1KGL8_9HELO|nr:uncharacterized protein RAG0_06324 [Rhynchosporium agropyri]
MAFSSNSMAQAAGSEDPTPSGKTDQATRTSRGRKHAGLLYRLKMLILTECQLRCGSLWDIHNLYYVGEYDGAGDPSLIPKKKWESLSGALLKRQIYSNTDPRARSIISNSRAAFYNIVRVKAIRYMSSRPGPDFAETEIHAIIRVSAIWSRTEINSEREHLVGESAKYKQAAKDFLMRFDSIEKRVTGLDIIDSPIPGQGYDDSIPWYYLAAELAKSPLPSVVTDEMLQSLSQYMQGESMRAARSPLGIYIHNQPDIKALREQLYLSVGKSNHKLGSLSQKTE